MKRLANVVVGLALVCAHVVAYGPAVLSGNGEGQAPLVRLDSRFGTIYNFAPWETGFLGGTTVAKGDIDGDGVPDMVCGRGPGGVPEVKVFSGATGLLVKNFMGFDASFTGGVRVATGDVNGDGIQDIIAGAGPGGSPRVRVFDGGTGAALADFFAYEPSFTGGVFVAGGDTNADGYAEVVVGAGPGGGPRVRVFDGLTNARLLDFLAFDPGFAGGVCVAAGDYNGDGRADVFTSTGAGTEITQAAVFNGVNGLNLFSWAPFGSDKFYGARVAAVDLDGDGLSDTTVQGVGPYVRVYPTLTGAAGMFDLPVRAADFGGELFIAGNELKDEVRFQANLPHRAPGAPPVSIEILQMHLGAVPPHVLPPLFIPENKNGGERCWTAFGGINSSFYIKGRNTLGVKVANVFVFNGLDLGPLTLKGGDVNGDDSVNIQDFLQLRASFGFSVGQPAYNPDADLDGNGSVAIGDFLILRTNFGQSGPGL
ncbi:MAG: FG-GAP repeat protein [Fimbriimonadaceae bacterium]|nr:FG-GAP repeat protein [Fimbriimonadaceae bacterium]